MGTREAKVESYLQERVEALGGECFKWVSPGNVGVTDQIMSAPGHFPPTFVEVKTYDGERSPVQIRMHRRLKKAGFPVYTVYGRAGVDRLLEAIDADAK